MSQKHIQSTSADTDKTQLSLTNNRFLIIRLVLASIIFAASLILRLPGFAQVLTLAVSAVLAGYDIVFQAVSAVENGGFLDLPVLVIAVAFLSFFIGFGIEGTAVILLFQIGMLLLRYAADHVRKTALESLHTQNEEIVSHLHTLAQDESGTFMELENVMRSSAGGVLRLAMILAVACAVAMPLITSLSFRISIHRALMILMIATPFSVIVSIPIAGYVGLCRCAGQGIVFGNAYSMEAAADVSVAVFDKSIICSDQIPGIVTMRSDVLDYNTFLSFVAHAVYYSDQPFSRAISAVFDQEYKLEVITDFQDLPGCGVALSVDGIPVTFARADYLRNKGLELPEDDEAENAVGTVFYMFAANRPMGKVVFSSEINQNLEHLVSEMKTVGIERCVLLSEDGREAEQHYADELDFTELYAESDTKKKYQIIREIVHHTKDAVLFVYSSAFEEHSDAAIDIRADRRAKTADAIVLPEAIAQLPQIKPISRRVREICIENALFAFLLKAVLVFLSIIGYCNLWLVILIDLAAAILTVFNSSRAANESFRNNLQYKLGR